VLCYDEPELNAAKEAAFIISNQVIDPLLVWIFCLLFFTRPF